MEGRFWCLQCQRVLPLACCAEPGHATRRVGHQTAIDVVVIDRRYDVDVAKHGFLNNVGHAYGRSAAQQEAVTRRTIEQMRVAGIKQQRENRLKGGNSDQPQVVGAMPSARLLALKRQYGDSFTQRPKEVLQREGLYWGRG